jgi:hypothetical protein
MTTFDNENKLFLSFKYYCKKCDYGTCKKSNYNTHINSLKHTKTTFDNQIKPILSQKKHLCLFCDKSYNDRAGLWRHKKKCNFNNDNLKQKTEDIINYLMKENDEFKQIILDQNKQMVDLAKNTGNNNNNNTNNNSFNLQFFLNDTCKDALNIMDFVNQLQITNKDLEATGRLGFVQGISNIFINGLKDLDVSNRPVHCSDTKRETIYIKNDNQWNKETEEKVILTNALKHVVSKNIKQIPQWTKEHPKYNDYYSKENDTYLHIVSEAMSGSTKEETNNNYCKIIKNISKEAIIPKSVIPV